MRIILTVDEILLAREYRQRHECGLTEAKQAIFKQRLLRQLREPGAIVTEILYDLVEAIL